MRTVPVVRNVSCTPPVVFGLDAIVYLFFTNE